MYPQKTRMPNLMEERGKPQLRYEKKRILPEILVSTPDLKSNPPAQWFQQTVIIWKWFYCPKTDTDWSLLSPERDLFWEAAFYSASASRCKVTVPGLKKAPKGAGSQAPCWEGADPSWWPRQTGKGGMHSTRQSQGRGAGSLLSESFFPSPCCYQRAPSLLKPSMKAGSCLPGQRGVLSISSFLFLFCLA